MNNTELYDRLGVALSETMEYLKKAGRKKMMASHPDHGGNRAEFEKIREAFEILTDPELRNLYDETGEIPSLKVDNERAAALTVIQLKIADIFNEWMNTGFTDRIDFDKRKSDIRKFDVVDEIRLRLAEDIATAQESIKRGERHVMALEDIGARFTTKGEQNAIADGFRKQAEDARETIEGLRKSIKTRQAAIVIVGEFKYRADEFGIESEWPYDRRRTSGLGASSRLLK